MLVDFQLGGTLKLKLEDGYCLLAVRYEDFTISARGNNMAYTLPNDHEVKMKIAYVDSKGNPAAVDGEVTWDTSDEEIVGVEVGTDTTEVTVTPRTRLGTAQVTAQADADLGEGTRPIVTTIDVTVVAGEAVAGTISPVGAPTPIGG